MPVLFQHQLLTRARVELGLTQEDAARAAGVDVRTYRRYESGEVNEGGSFALQRASRRKIVERLCRELGLSEDELLKPLEAPAIVTTSLPRAPHFVGRAPQLARLGAWLSDHESTARVLAIVAIGGAGKTSLVEKALADAKLGRAPFVHSFYEQPSIDVFLRSAATYLGQTGGEAFDDLLAGLLCSPTALLVLDGLEIAQADGEGGRARGELTDRRLARALRAITRDRKHARLLVTSRLPLADLAAFDGRELDSWALPALDTDEAQALLKKWGAKVSPSIVESALARTGGHALSLSVVGSYASELLQGDLGAALGLDLADAAREQPLARKLQAILEKYATELAPLERQLLIDVCLFPRGATLEVLARTPGAAEAPEIELRAGLGRLLRRGLVVKPAERYSAHPFIRAHFASANADATRAFHQRESARIEGELGEPQRLEGALALDRAEQLFEHTLLAGDTEKAYRVLRHTLGGFSHLGLRLGELERGLRLVRALAPVVAQLPPEARWRVVYDRGLYAAALGDLDEAVRAYRTLLASAEPDSTTHRTLAYTLRLRGELAAAHHHVERSIQLGLAQGAPDVVARGLALRGALLTSEGRLNEAAYAFAEARATGDAPTARRSIWEAEHLLALGETDRAVAQTLENLEACRRRQWAGHVAHCHVVLGRAALARGALDAAEDALDAALDWCRSSKEVELTLEARLLELHIARESRDEARREQVAALLLDAAIAGGYAEIRAKLERA